MSLKHINLEQVVLGQHLRVWLLALGVIIVGYAVIRLVQWLLTHRLLHLDSQEQKPWYGIILGGVRRSNAFLLLLIVIYAGMQFLDLPPAWASWSNAVAIIAIILQVGLWLDGSVIYWFNHIENRTSAPDPSRITTMRASKLALRLILLVIVVLLTLDNVPGVKITALVASLGVGGIAVALALQNILGDLFASLSIVLDKPFVVGDFIIVDAYMGTVENVGLKTTRVRSLSGEQLIFANNDLLKSRIRNYKRMNERRVVFSIGVTYQTPVAALEQLPGVIREVIQSQDRTRFDRAHFASYGDFALNFEVVYYVLSSDYNVYMDIQQTINLRIFRHFEQAGIEFAYPTRTLFINAASDG